jgi:calcineurin-like phosphoesterase
VKTIIKILIAAAILNAVVHIGMVYATYYQLKDAALQMVTFGEKTAAADIQTQLVQKAQELKVPVNPDDVAVHREAQHTTASVSYTQPIEVFPSYQYPMNFRFSVDAYSMSGLK